LKIGHLPLWQETAGEAVAVEDGINRVNGEAAGAYGFVHRIGMKAGFGGGDAG